jgi:hypothetical protein
LYAPYTDKTLMRDFLAYELHGKMGHYSVRTRFVEVFVDSSRGKLTMSDYAGVYVFEEKLKRGKDRVDIVPLLPTDNAEPEITGGYLIKKDRLDPGDSGFSTGHAGTLAYVDPKEDAISPAQGAWLRSWFTQFETALYGANFRDPVNGYARFIDADSFIDQHWIVEMSKNIDGFRLSNYMHKDRLGKLKMDPIWDWNLSFGNANYYTGWLTNGWYWSQTGGGTEYPWFARLFQDPDFTQRYIDRWGELRKDIFATSNILARVDELEAFLNESQIRNYQRWRILGTYVWPNQYIGKTYQDEITWMKQWIVGRLAWIDTNYTPVPAFSNQGGPITSGFTLSLAASKGVIYYTLNGVDPRLPGGAVNPQAAVYSSPIPLSANARVFARARNGTSASSWSPPAAATFVVSWPTLAITEIMYHPPGPPAGSSYNADDFEFIELKNVGTTTLNLAGIHFTNGIAFSFTGSAVTGLGPGQHVVVVKNLEAFASRYGAVPNVAGPFSGSLDNSGEHLALEGALGEPILDFDYNDTWYPTTDSLGFSLVAIDEHAPSNAWGKKANWRASASPGGSPGADDPTPNIPRVWISEVLTHTDLPEVDSIELYNPNSTDVSISNWYLTDQRAVPKKFRITSVIPAGGYAVFTEADWNANPDSTTSFRLNSHGEEIYLFSADANGDLTGFSDGFSFGAAQNGVSFGRYAISTGEAQYPAQMANTLGQPNAGPRTGPVVINEIQYHPALGNEEFIELKNISAAPVKLYDPLHPTNTWKLNGAGFRFPSGAEIQGLLLLVGGDPAAFRLKYNVPAVVPIFALYPGVLQGGGESLSLQRPDTPDVDPNTGAIFVPYIDVDVVRYNDKAPWPTNADGFGPSLERLDAGAYGNDPINWRASLGPGTPGREKQADIDVWKGRYFTAAELADPLVSGDAADPDGDGQTTFQEYLAGTDPRDAQSLLTIDSATASGGTPQTIRLRFNGVADRTYTVQYQNSAGVGTWLKLTNIPPPLVSGMMDVSIARATNLATRYYRVITPWQP